MGKRKGSGNRYAIYLRCSTDDQKQGDFTTIDTQRKLNTQFVEKQNGVLVKEYVDEGRTGTNLKRTGWNQLLEDAKAGSFDFVCCTYMSRLARGNVYYVAEYLLRESNVRIALVQEQFTADLAGHVNREMTILMDGMYPKMVSQWTRTKMEQMVAQGYFCGGTIPLGYLTQPIESANRGEDKSPPKKFVINEDEAEIVRQAYDTFLQHGTVSSVRDYLKTATNRIWTSTTARYLLTNVVYIGVQEFGNWRNDKAHPAIVDREKWQAVQSILEAAKIENTRLPHNDLYTYYLRGLIRCPHCDCNFTNSFAKDRTVYYYECHNGKKKITDCPVCRVNSDALHNAVLREIGRAVEHQTVMHSIIRDSGGWKNADESLKSLRGQLGKKRQFVDVQINNLTNLLADGRGQMTLLAKLDDLEQVKKDITAQIENLDVQIAQSTVKRPSAEMVQQSWSMITEAWDYTTEEERAELMKAFVNKVVVDEKKSVTLFLSAASKDPTLRVRINGKNGSGDWI